MSSRCRFDSLIPELTRQGHGVILTMGKGGVGKTTVATRVALALARHGHKVHLSTTDPAAHLDLTLGSRVPNLTVSRIDPAKETAEYTAEVMATAGKDLDDQGKALLEEDLRSPCTEEIAVFRAFARTVDQGKASFVVLDTAPTGHTLLLLDATEAYHRDVLRNPSDMPESVRELLPRLRDPEFTKVLIVTLPEATPVHEAASLQRDLLRAGITPFAWVINQSLSSPARLRPGAQGSEAPRAGLHPRGLRGVEPPHGPRALANRRRRSSPRSPTRSWAEPSRRPCDDEDSGPRDRVLEVQDARGQRRAGRQGSGHRGRGRSRCRRSPTSSTFDGVRALPALAIDGAGEGLRTGPEPGRNQEAHRLIGKQVSPKKEDRRMTQEIVEAVRSKYGSVATSGLSSEQQGVRAVAEAFGYSAEELSSIPAEANMGLSCGNPTATASLKPGEVVVDLGSGGGLDVFLAAKKVGPTGKAIGIDMTPEMIDLARKNAEKAGLSNVEFHHAAIDRMPLPDASADCVISNCVLNLVPDKPAAMREIARILKPGGRLAVSDIALKKPLPPELSSDLMAYVGCIAGAILVEDYRAALHEAGFAHVEVIDSARISTPTRRSKTSPGAAPPRPSRPSPWSMARRAVRRLPSRAARAAPRPHRERTRPSSSTSSPTSFVVTT